MNNLSQSIIVNLMDIYWDRPDLFCEDILGFIPDNWQREVMKDLADHPKVSVRSGQGVGKTGLEASVVIWFLCCRPNPKVICTAPTRQQLYDVLWAEIAKWLNDSKVKNLLEWTKTKVYMKKHEDRWFATAKTATRPENMQGFHEDYMLFVIDEASGVTDPIMEAILGTLSGQENKLLMCGNPTRTSGVFYDSHNKDRDLYKAHKVSSLDSKRTSKDNIEMLRRKYHEGSDVWRVRVEGEFPEGESDAFIPLEFAELAKETKVNISEGETMLHLGVDVARFGDDETDITPRIGGKIFRINSYSKQDTMKTTGYVINTAIEYMKKYPSITKVRIRVDDTGVGGGVTDRLNEVVKERSLPFEVIPVNNGSKANDEHYDNLGTECWGIVRELLEENFTNHVQGKSPIIEFPDDEKLISQLSTRKYNMTSRGKIAIESKKDMKKRGLNSPDRADSVVLSLYEPPVVSVRGSAVMANVDIFEDDDVYDDYY